MELHVPQINCLNMITCRSIMFRFPVSCRGTNRKIQRWYEDVVFLPACTAGKTVRAMCYFSVQILNEIGISINNPFSLITWVKVTSSVQWNTFFKTLAPISSDIENESNHTHGWKICVLFLLASELQQNSVCST